MPEQPPNRRGRRDPQIAAAMEGDFDLSAADVALGQAVTDEHSEPAETGAELPMLTPNGIITKASTVYVEFEYGMNGYFKTAASDGAHPGESPEDAADRLTWVANTGVLDQVADFDERAQAFLEQKAARRAAVLNLDNTQQQQ